MKRTHALTGRVLQFIRQHALVPAGARLVVAVSGGPDSVCLLHTLVQLREAFDIELHVAHLDHQLRGSESEFDACYVAGLARKLGLPSTIAARDVKVYQAQKHISLEEAAREVRYSFLAEVVKSVGADRVAVGHTQNDHIETILMHLVRGSGTAGLRGMQPLIQLPNPTLIIIRPLLEITREETVAYCSEHSLAPRLDITNLSLSPLRNRIRQQLLPLLESYNPAVRQALLRTACIASEDLAFIDSEGHRRWRKVARRQGRAVIFNRERFLALPPALQRHILRLAIEELVGSVRDIEMVHVEDMLDALPKPAGKKLTLPDGLIFYVDYDHYLLSAQPLPLPFPLLNGEHPLNIPGVTRVSGWRITARIVDKKEMESPSDFATYLDFDRIGKKLVLRSRRRGDRFQPLGMAQNKKLGQFMLDAKIPQAWRDNVPIVASPSQIVWVGGYRIDERVKVTGSTKKVLLLKMERTDGQSGGGNR